MVSVFVIGAGGKFCLDVFNILKNSCETSLFSREHCIINSNSSVQLLEISASTNILTQPNAIIICNNVLEKEIFLPKGCTAISLESNSISFITDGTQQIISCGMGKKDTITFSSIEEESCAMAIMRPLKAFSNEEIEIGEHFITFKKGEFKAAVVSCCVLLLTNGYL